MFGLGHVPLFSLSPSPPSRLGNGGVDPFIYLIGRIRVHLKSPHPHNAAEPQPKVPRVPKVKRIKKLSKLVHQTLKKI
jgi:hypothetical protein